MLLIIKKYYKRGLFYKILFAQGPSGLLLFDFVSYFGAKSTKLTIIYYLEQQPLSYIPYHY
jgi:hypothetical protein